MPLVVACLLVLVVALLLLGSVSPLSVVVVLLDAPLPVLLLAAAWGYGVHLRRGLLGERCDGSSFSDRADGLHACAAIGLGSLALSVVTLILGMAGWLGDGAAWALLIAGWAAGLAHILRSRPARTAGQRVSNRWRLGLPELAALVMAAPVLAMLLFSASLPPGVLWVAEGRGYDVLEYHLQAPREFFDAGAIHFLGHNVYASFPQQAELQYLLLMHLLGDAHAAAIPSQMLHAAYAVLGVVALAAAVPAGATRAAAIALGATVPWLAYVGPLAYVEAPLVFFAAVAAGLALRACDFTSAGWRTWLTAGLLAGASAGCKYTAVVLTAAALAATSVMCMKGAWPLRLRMVMVFSIGAVMAFAPWAIRNALQADNPLYPFGYEWFGGRDWSPGQNEQWARGHAPKFESIAERWSAVARELMIGRAGDAWRPALFGPLLFPLAIVGFACQRDRRSGASLVWMLLILLCWFTLTHMPGRFAMPAMIPAVWLAAGLAGTGGARGRAAFWLIAIVAAGGVAQSFMLLRSEDRWSRERLGVSLKEFVGQVDALRDLNPIQQLPSDAHVHLVGPAAVYYADRPMRYTVVFNRDPWIEFSRERTAAESVGWLRDNGVTHVAFDWSEIGRLAATYGFAEFVKPEWVLELETVGLRRVPLSAPETFWVFEIRN